MNILVFSDSHGDVDVMAELTARWRPDRVLHLGDHFSDMVKLHLRFPEIPMQGVRGNCDAPGSPESLRLTLEGATLLLIHGKVEFFNPGSVGRGWPPSDGLLRLGDGPMSAEIITL